MEIKNQLKKQIENLKLEWLDDVCITAIPTELLNKDKLTTMLIIDVNTELFDLGNNSFSSIKKMIQIQIFFSKKLNIDLDEAVNDLLRFLLSESWTTAGYSAFVDPETKQQSKTIKLTKIFYMKEG